MNKLLAVLAFTCIEGGTPAVACQAQSCATTYAEHLVLAQYRIDPSAPSDLRLQFDGNDRMALDDTLPAKINPVTPPISSPSADISRAGQPVPDVGTGVSRFGTRQERIPRSNTVPRNPPGGTRGNNFSYRR